ncbi:carbohydrate ABC transporter permease [Nonomuraea gerenzanensis]|uniref:Binding-protein-dependent transport systems inner membrane component n=1 Tax=Nonomuraea gerenzanensis TaxID=93944 RepID=A0A1M4EIQ3_9ACTN|nr:sugar ABC transporter permease [Nonomuraea gerenzanensis]UBU10183.1 sugar ABC transporter permease [Nonomuraea gerenzanensis]SBO98558.1 binding-protein-dependent transport systems inner membrane component [Nonomuraea gerenzanensis]
MAVLTRQAPPAPAPVRVRGALRRSGVGWLFVLPFVVLFAVFYLGPLLVGIGMSFTDLRSTDVADPLAVDLVGAENYLRLMNDGAMRRAALNTVVFVLTALPLTIGLGLAAAVLLNTGIARLPAAFFRLGYYLPNITSIIGIAVAWKFLLEPDAGLVNRLLGLAGVEGPDWLGTEATALPSIIVMTAWRSFGFTMVVLLAALQTIPRELYEAAAVDGAGRWARFHAVTLPSLRPVLLFCTVYSSVGFMQFLEEPLVMTRGGPLDATLSASLAIFNQFGVGDYGYAGAASTVLFTVIVALAVLQLRLGRKR